VLSRFADLSAPRSIFMVSRGPQPRPSPLGELLCRGHQQLADAVRRLVGAAPMTEGDLLYLSACLVGHRVGQPDGVEVVPPPR
jgi:hypothetical protein